MADFQITFLDLKMFYILLIFESTFMTLGEPEKKTLYLNFSWIWWWGHLNILKQAFASSSVTLAPPWTQNKIMCWTFGIRCITKLMYNVTLILFCILYSIIISVMRYFQELKDVMEPRWCLDHWVHRIWLYGTTSFKSSLALPPLV